MSEDAERIKTLVTFKRKLEARVEKLDSELKDTQAMLDTVKAILLEKGFKRVEIKDTTSESPALREEITTTLGSSPPSPQAETENVTQLKTTTGELLATLYVSEGSLRVLPAQDKNFDINTPPFNHFLVERVLLKMQERDNELARAGHVTPDRIFCYNIARDGDIIRAITIKNLDSDRLRELKSSIRWTLEKMYEKSGSSGCHN